MKKLCFISPVASPHQVRLAPYLQRYFDTTFFFYERLGRRQEWWNVDLGEHCRILPRVITFRCRHYALSPLRELERIQPDIVMLGGFSDPSNYPCYLWARRHHRKTVIETERSRTKTGKIRGYTLPWRIMRFLYRDVDLVMCTGQDIVPQFRDTFRFGPKAVAGQYPSDIDKYFKHPARGKKDAYTLIYANRMIPIYNPIGAVEIFAEILKRYPKTKLKMNASGELRPEVERRIAELGIGKAVEFLDAIKHWDDLDAVYAASDILYLPARFSNGNYTVTEAMASGMGVVISDAVLGMTVPFFRETGSGFVCPVDNAAFVEKICWIMEHPEWFSTAAAINRKFVKHFTLESTAKLYYDLFCPLFANDGKSPAKT